MSENLSFIIILEFVAPFAILSIVLLLALLNSNKKSKKGLTQLLHSVKDGENNYKEKLTEFLKKSGVDESGLEERVQNFCKSRREFFKQTLSALNNGDGELLKGLSSRFGLFSDLYHQLELSAESPPVEEDEAVVEGSDDSSTELEATYKVVKRENKRLKAEVHVSVSALNSLFKEYSSMFGEVANGNADMSVQEVLEAMEKFTKGDFKPDNIAGDEPPGDEDNEDSVKAQEESDEESTPVEDTAADDIEVDQDEDSEPNWDEAFEETGETPDEATMADMKQTEETSSKATEEPKPDPKKT